MDNVIDWSSLPLGIDTDAEIARSIGKSRGFVQKNRVLLGIGAKPTPNSTKGIDWDNQPLGEMPDPDLAKILGCKKTSVLRARKSRGIPAFYDPRSGRIEVTNGICGCGVHGELTRFRGELICNDCLNPPLSDQDIAAFCDVISETLNDKRGII